MRLGLRCIVSVLFVLLLAAMATWAGITGSISGLVKDPSGAVITGAHVTAIQTQTGIRTETVTDSKGFYSFPTLAIGTYDVEVHASGFKVLRQTGIVIDANSAVQADIKLELGTTSAVVEVRSNAVQVETQSTQMGEVITGTQMTTVPLNGRAFTDLLSLQPGVVPAGLFPNGAVAPGLNDRSPSGGLNSGNQSVNGQRESANGFMVNGATVEEGKNNGAAVIPNLDSISEFRIITNNFDAEYGNYSGGQINVATKSGTNDIHGSGFEFFRNTDLNARNFFNPGVGPNAGPKGSFLQNQFGGTLGGPIKKDKIFFFVDYQGTRETQGQTVNTQVPTQADQSGNITDQLPTLSAAYAASLQSGGSPAGTVQGAQLAQNLSAALGYPVMVGEPYYYGAGVFGPNAPACSSSTGPNPCVFANPAILTNPAILSQLSPVAAKILAGGYIPLGNGQGTLITSAYSTVLDDDKGGVRVDGNSRFGMLSAYYFIDNYNRDDPYPNGGATVPGYDALSLGRAQLINLGDTKNIGSSSVNEFHLNFVRNVANLFEPKGGLGPSLQSLGFVAPNCPANQPTAGCQFNGGVGPTAASLQGVPNITFNNYTIGVPSDTVNQYNNTYQVIDAFSKVVGTHNVKFGGEYHYAQINERNYYGENGSYSFTGSETGSDFVDFLIGAPSSFIQASHQVLDSRTQYMGLFAQDSWRVTPRLTFNYGLRYEISLPWYDTQNKTETIIPGVQSVVFPGAPTGWLVPGDPGVPRTLAPPQYDAFSPRLGLAYSPDFSDGLLGGLTGGPGKTSIRVGWGLYYTAVEDLSQFLEVGDPPYGIFWVSSAPPFLATPFLNRTDNSVETVSGTNPFPFVFPSTNVSPKNPNTTFPWENVEPISSGFVFYYKNRMPYSEHYELSLQRQLFANTILSASYVGNQGHRLITSVEANPGSPAICEQVNAILGAGTCGPFGENNQYVLPPGTPTIPGAFYLPETNTITGTRTVLNPLYFGSNPYMEESANSAFNSFQLSVRHSSNRGDFLVGYTLGKCLDNSSGLQDSTLPTDPRLSRGLCLFNVHQNFVVSYNYNFEFDKMFHADHGFTDRLLGGWSLSGITTFSTGLPIALMENDDNSLYGVNTAPVDVPELSGVGQLFAGGTTSSKNPRSGLPYFNPGYFTTEPLGQIGNADRRFFSGPGLNNWDMALLKNTRITESKSIQFRCEAFNIWNHAQFQNPTGLINSSLFGIVTAANPPRILQLAGKFIF
jgi:Carboxypeptidase regulatory-like domain/TonB dependent receptor